MNRIILAALCGILTLAGAAQAQLVQASYDAGSDTTTVVASCDGDHRSTLCGPVLQLIEGGQPTAAVVMFQTPMTGEYAGVRSDLPSVMAAASMCIVCTPEQQAAEVRAASAASLSNAYERMVETARQILRGNAAVREHPAVLAAWQSSQTVPSALLPPQVVITVRQVYEQLRREAIAARQAAAEAAAAAAEAAANGGE